MRIALILGELCDLVSSIKEDIVVLENLERVDPYILHFDPPLVVREPKPFVILSTYRRREVVVRRIREFKPNKLC